MTATAKDLLLSILALDSYNRGYNPGMVVTGNQVGSAIIETDSSIEIGLALTQAVAFYAVAYNWNGETVVSYRGTTFEVGLNTLRDVLYGWTLGIGYGSASQPQLAKEFYTAVTGQPVYGAAPAANVVVTGHSLGGGLAAFVASLTGGQANIYNNIPFGAGVVAEIMSHNLSQGADDLLALLTGGGSSGGTYVGLPTSSGNIRQLLTAGEVAGLFRQASPLFSAPIFAADLAKLPGGPVVAGVLAGLAAGYGVGLDNSANSQTLSSYSGFPTNPVNLHSQSLMVLLTYADVRNLTDWTQIGPALYGAYFNADLGKSVGFTEGGNGGWYGYEAKLLASVAYSALDSGERPFGDAAIRALFDDADQLGKIAGAEATTLLKSDPVKTALAEIAVQFAGDLALSKVLREDAAWAKTGAFELVQSNRVLVADLDPEKWRATFNKDTASGAAKTGQEKIVGVETLLSSLLKLETEGGRGTEFLGNPDQKLKPDIIEAINAWKAAAAPAGGGAAATLSASQRVTLLAAGADGQRVDLDAVALARQTLGKDGEPRTAVPLAHDGEPGGAVLIGTALNDGLAGENDCGRPGGGGLAGIKSWGRRGGAGLAPGRDASPRLHFKLAVHGAASNDNVPYARLRHDLPATTARAA